jgi:hypothetical protein
MGANPICIKVSHQCGSKQYSCVGNQTTEATASDISGYNESECIEPRNTYSRGGRRTHR